MRVVTHRKSFIDICVYLTLLSKRINSMPSDDHYSILGKTRILIIRESLYNIFAILGIEPRTDLLESRILPLN